MIANTEEKSIELIPRNLLEARGLKRHYGNVAAVDGVDLNVRSGEIYGFLGINGAGKTTTIRVLMGIIAAEAGTLFTPRASASPHDSSCSSPPSHVDSDLCSSGRLNSTPLAESLCAAFQLCIALHASSRSRCTSPGLAIKTRMMIPCCMRLPRFSTVSPTPKRRFRASSGID